MNFFARWPAAQCPSDTPCARRKAVGRCWIGLVGVLCVSGVSVEAQERVTFAREVAPILFAQCAPCHRPNGPAPFALVSYADAKRRAQQIALVTKSRAMPPWKAETGHQEYADSRVLTARQIAMIQQWVESGAA